MRAVLEIEWKLCWTCSGHTWRQILSLRRGLCPVKVFMAIQLVCCAKPDWFRNILLHCNYTHVIQFGMFLKCIFFVKFTKFNPIRKLCWTCSRHTWRQILSLPRGLCPVRVFMTIRLVCCAKPGLFRNILLHCNYGHVVHFGMFLKCILFVKFTKLNPFRNST